MQKDFLRPACSAGTVGKTRAKLRDLRTSFGAVAGSRTFEWGAGQVKRRRRDCPCSTLALTHASLDVSWRMDPQAHSSK